MDRIWPITYDASGRVTSLAQTAAAGDIRTTSFGYGTDYTAVTAPDGQVTKLYYETGGNIAPGSINDWNYGGVSKELVTSDRRRAGR